MHAWQNHNAGRYQGIVTDHNRTANDVLERTKVVGGRDHGVTKTEAAQTLG